MKVKSVTVIAILSILTAISISASTVSPPEGGTWDYGTNSSVVWSNYYHPSKTHKSCVHNGRGVVVDPGWKDPKKTSYASTASTIFVDRSYYDVKQ